MTEPSDDDDLDPPPDPLPPQRGGTPDPSHIVGRDHLVRMLWAWLLAGESLVITSERRTGKTATLRLLEASAPAGTIVIYRDVEGITSPEKLVESLTADVVGKLGGLAKAKTKMRDWIIRLGGLEVGPVTLPKLTRRDWALHLDELFVHAADHGLTVVILWDEMPWLVDRLAKTQGSAVAIEVLDQLRAVRQSHRSVRFVFTGSIGFHHVLRTLRDGLSHRTAINDMRQVELPDLAQPDATRLAWSLLRGAGLETESTPAVAAAIAAITDGVPWFIHAIVDDLRTRGGTADLEAVETVVDAAILGSGWELSHYIERLAHYYGEDWKLAAATLDAIAVNPQATTAAILQDLHHQQVSIEKDQLLDLLKLLTDDQYLLRLGRSDWGFRYGLVQRAWLALRDLP